MKRNNWGTFFIAAGVLLFVAYLVYTNPFKVLMEVGRFDSWMFVAAVGVNYVGLVFLSASWHIMLKSLGFKTSLWNAVQISFVGLFVVWMLPFPSGFELVRAYLIRDKEGGNWGKAVSSVIVSKVYYFISFGLMISIAALIVRFVNGSNIPIRHEFIWFAVLFALANMVTFAIILTPKIMLRINEKSPDWLKTRMQKMYIQQRIRVQRVQRVRLRDSGLAEYAEKETIGEYYVTAACGFSLEHRGYYCLHGGNFTESAHQLLGHCAHIRCYRVHSAAELHYTRWVGDSGRWARGGTYCSGGSIRGGWCY